MISDDNHDSYVRDLEPCNHENEKLTCTSSTEQRSSSKSLRKATQIAANDAQASGAFGLFDAPVDVSQRGLLPGALRLAELHREWQGLGVLHSTLAHLAQVQVPQTVLVLMQLSDPSVGCGGGL